KASKAEEQLRDALAAVEVHPDSLRAARRAVALALVQAGINTEASRRLAKRWVVQGDFLQIALDGQFTHIVGNPPYVRQELIPNELLAQYRSRYRTLYDRADLYIPFFERSLELLAPRG